MSLILLCRRLLKTISQYKYVNHKDLKGGISTVSGHTVRNLLSADLIQRNNLSNDYVANAYDCSVLGDELLQKADKASKAELINLLAGTTGTFVSTIISQVYDAA